MPRIQSPSRSRHRIGRALEALGAFVYFAVDAPNFLTGKNFQAIGYSVAVIGILTVPFTIALVAGQIDLTVGIMIGLLSSIFEVVVVRSGQPLVVGLLAMLAAAVLVGAVNGVIVVNFCVGICALPISPTTFSLSTLSDRVNVPGPLAPSSASVHSPRYGAASAGDTSSADAPRDTGARQSTRSEADRSDRSMSPSASGPGPAWCMAQ